MQLQLVRENGERIVVAEDVTTLDYGMPVGHVVLEALARYEKELKAVSNRGWDWLSDCN